MTEEQRKAYIVGLLEERHAAEVYGRSTKEIDAELKRVGHSAKPPAKRAAKRSK